MFIFSRTRQTLFRRCNSDLKWWKRRCIALILIFHIININPQIFLLRILISFIFQFWIDLVLLFSQKCICSIGYVLRWNHLLFVFYIIYFLQFLPFKHLNFVHVLWLLKLYLVIKVIEIYVFEMILWWPICWFLVKEWVVVGCVSIPSITSLAWWWHEMVSLCLIHRQIQIINFSYLIV